MTIFNWLSFLGGIAMFLYGMHVMGQGLSNASSGKMESFLEKATSNPITAVLLGAGVTAVIQSSSATTVMVVGFVNSGIMKLEQAVGVIMGANIGTTATSWILSLTGVSGESLFMQLLKPEAFAPAFAFAGVILVTFIKKETHNNLGSILFGFGLLMIGMEFMSGAVAPLAESPEFAGFLTMFSNPILGILAGAAFTAAVQSSSASVGILQALIMTGSITFGSVLPIIMGQNIGTCVTALISSAGTTKNAKRAAMIHLYFNIIGTVIFVAIFYTINAFHHFDFLDQPASLFGVAIFHTLFNIMATAILLPGRKLLLKLAYATVRGEDEKDDGTDEVQRSFLARLDDRFVRNPGLALEQTSIVVNQMAKTSADSLRKAIRLLWDYDEETAKKVDIMESQVDIYEDRIGSYLLKMNASDMTIKEVDNHGLLLRCIGDLERISDHAMNVMEAAKEKYEKGEVFSESVSKEMEVFARVVLDTLDMAVKALETRDMDVAKSIEPLEEVVDSISDQLKDRRVQYLAVGECSPVIGFILSDLNIDLERVGDHCSNIGATLIEVGKNDFDMHEYLDHELKENHVEDFKQKIEEAAAKYKLPESVVKVAKKSSQPVTRIDPETGDRVVPPADAPKKEKPRTSVGKETDDDDDSDIPELH